MIGPSGAIATADQLTTSGQNCQPESHRRMRISAFAFTTATLPSSPALTSFIGPTARRFPSVGFTSVWVKIDGAWKHANYQATPVVEGATPR